jgi:DNA (cytosine-5)-methyltransferase 1
MPFISSYYSPGTNTGSAEPLPTVTTKDRFGIVAPFLTAYYGNGFVSSVREAVPTITTKDRFGVVQGRILIMPDGRRYKLDITHRMLTSRELAAATGFPQDYKFAGSDTDAKKMIGNAVCPDLAEALYRAVLSA